MTDLLRDYLESKDLAGQLGVSLRTIYRWNSLGYGPPRTKIGAKVLYHIDAVRAWLKDHERGPVRQK